LIETVLLEPNLKTTKHSFVAAKCLIKNKPESLFIQVLNPTDDIIKVHSGYVIASIDKIDHNNIIDMSNKNLKDQSNNKQLTVFCLNDKVLFCQSKQASFF
jgi:hypothetical protein